MDGMMAKGTSNAQQAGSAGVESAEQTGKSIATRGKGK